MWQDIIIERLYKRVCDLTAVASQALRITANIMLYKQQILSHCLVRDSFLLLLQDNVFMRVCLQ